MGGEAVSVAAGDEKVSPHVKSAFGVMRFIVTAGWSIYPLGYFFGYLMGGVDDDSLNLVYNLADFVNKIAFCLAIWQSAKTDTREELSKDALLGSNSSLPFHKGCYIFDRRGRCDFIKSEHEYWLGFFCFIHGIAKFLWNHPWSPVPGSS